jgi:hypothetical protein
MIQWVASPLNQGHSFLTGMPGEGEDGGARSPRIAEEAEYCTNLDSSAIHSMRILKTLTR